MIPVVDVVALFQTTQSYNKFFLEGEKTQTMPVLKNFVDLGQPKPNSMTYMSKELYTKEHTLASRSDASAKYDTLHYLLTPRLTGYEGWGERATPPLPLPDPRLPPRLLHLPRPLSFWLRRKVLQVYLTLQKVLISGRRIGGLCGARTCCIVGSWARGRESNSRFKTNIGNMKNNFLLELTIHGFIYYFHFQYLFLKNQFQK